jgi:hypothetical protein
MLPVICTGFLPMSDLLLDINLQQVPDDYLAGAWRVAHRVLNRADPASTLAQATSLVLGGQALELEAPTQKETGSWAVLRDELLNRPYLRLNLPAEEMKALVTRLRRTTDGARAQLNLYFSSGLEMQLDRP